MPGPFRGQQARNDRVIVTEAKANTSLLFETKLLEELASPTIPLRGQTGDPGALQLTEGVLHNACNKHGRQPVGFYGSKAGFYVSDVGPVI